MVEDSKQAAAQESAQADQPTKAAGQAEVIPISEPSAIHRRIPKAVFIDDAEAWVDKYGEEELFKQMQELL